MTRKKRRTLTLISATFLLIPLLSACSVVETAPPTLHSAIASVPATAQGTPTALPTHRTTVTPELTLSPTLAPTQTLTSTPTPLPLSQEGPWLVFQADDDIWVVNADGSGGRPLARDLTIMDMAIAPRGGNIALIALPAPQTAIEETEFMLLSLPEGRLQTITLVMAEDFIDTVEASIPFEDNEQRHGYYPQLYAAVTYTNDIAWSLNGVYLVFAAVLDGPSADLYLYSLRNKTITRLTDGPAQAVDPAWSPDNKFVVHGAARSLNYGSSGSGYSMQGVWAARTDGLGSHLLYPTELYGFENVIGWLTPTTFLIDNWVWWSEYANLRKVSLGGKIWELWPGNYTLRAFDPQSRTVLIAIASYPNASKYDPTFDHPPGLYLLSVRTGEIRQVSEIGTDINHCSYLHWSPEAGLFFHHSSAGLIAIHPDGEIFPLGAPSDRYLMPTVAPNGQQWALSRPSCPGEIYLGSLEEPAQLIYTRHSFNPVWTLDSQGLFFFAGKDCEDATLYFARGPEFDPQAILENLHFTNCLPSPPAWVKP